MFQISILVLTYKPDLAKLLRTLRSCVTQKGVNFEIVISDDGSDNNLFPEVEAFFHQQKFSHYLLTACPKNEGTVQNCLNALLHSRGKYVFLTSPGDLIFDESVLVDFYNFAEARNAAICFGNPVPYCIIDNHPEITFSFCTPRDPERYVSGSPVEQLKKAFFSGSWINGASYFRLRQTAIEYFTRLAPYSRFTEDTTSSALALADGLPIHYFDRNIIWYETGSGLTSGGNPKFAKLVNCDIAETFSALKKQYPYDPFIDTAWANMNIKNKILRIMYKLFKHPVIFIQTKLDRPQKKELHYTSDDFSRLETLCR